MTDGSGEQPQALSQVLEQLVVRLSGRKSSLAELLDLLGHQATASILLIFSIPAIVPTPGIPAGMIFGTALAILSLQLIAGADGFYLPRRLGRVELPDRLLKAMQVRLGPKLAWLEGWLHPRLSGLASKGLSRLHGLFVLLMSLLIALPIPFGNVLPGFAIFFIALGLAQRDGVAVLIGLGLGVAAIAFSAFIFFGGWWLLERLPI
ncbi:exopolysaccharide biosynthesis protein [Rhizobium helianthi]|uniref:Exopolysaccharide biosynthesis protein n=1 Tax=Rhizobium helianthi TaxID=1132695 RepID=A0ABW4M8A1_9HYPH